MLFFTIELNLLIGKVVFTTQACFDGFFTNNLSVYIGMLRFRIVDQENIVE